MAKLVRFLCRTLPQMFDFFFFLQRETSQFILFQILNWISFSPVSVDFKFSFILRQTAESFDRSAFLIKFDPLINFQDKIQANNSQRLIIMI